MYLKLNKLIEQYQISNIYVTSDLHLYDKKILERQTNRLDFIQQYNLSHEDLIISRYNKIVHQYDLCFILGDLSCSNNIKTEEVLKQMNGYKFLIRGNHDGYILKESFNKDLFIGYDDYLEFVYLDNYVTMCHYPILHFAHQGRNGVHLYGHCHLSNIYKPYHSYHVGIDTNNLQPLELNNAIYLAMKEQTNLLRY